MMIRQKTITYGSKIKKLQKKSWNTIAYTLLMQFQKQGTSGKGLEIILTLQQEMVKIAALSADLSTT